MSKIYLEKAIFINKAPIGNLTLDFKENEISVLSSVNGKGKTTILSYIVDAFYEMARPHFQESFNGIENRFYRISSSLFSLDMGAKSFVYLRFKSAQEHIDYLEIRGSCSEEEYNHHIKIEDKISFAEVKNVLDVNSLVKIVSSNLDQKKAMKTFGCNLVTYFPAYRYEVPGYLNTPYSISLDFRKESRFSGKLINPIEVVTGLPQLANWIMDIVLDLRNNNLKDQTLYNNLGQIITKILTSKKLGELSFGIAPRNLGSSRIQIVNTVSRASVYPSIFNLSSGEVSSLCVFGEILRQADSLTIDDFRLDKISGIVLIDEIEKHLHIKLQKEVLPELLKLFPNVQFITTSHSPFFSMGLAKELSERSRIIDLDNLGSSRDLSEYYTNSLYSEVYEMMIGENNRFREKCLSLEEKIKESNIPLIVSEGKTDIQHLKKAKKSLVCLIYRLSSMRLLKIWVIQT